MNLLLRRCATASGGGGGGMDIQIRSIHFKTIQAYTKATLHTQASPPLASRTLLYRLLQGQCGQRHIYLNNGDWFSWRLLAISAITRNLKAFIIKGTKFWRDGSVGRTACEAQSSVLYPLMNGMWSPGHAVKAQDQSLQVVLWHPQLCHGICLHTFTCTNHTCTQAHTLPPPPPPS